MATVGEAYLTGLTRAGCTKRLNALTATLCGILPAVVLAWIRPVRGSVLLLSFLLGLVWANGFEYVYHRSLLHRPKCSLGKGHLLHHATVGTPCEPDHVTFGASPLSVALVFVVNGIPVVLVDIVLRLGIAAGILIAFSIYFIALEEMHWRIHLGGWLPPGLRTAREYHLAHHNTPDARFNVFLPLFDLLLGNLGSDAPPCKRSSKSRLSALLWSATEVTLAYVCVIALSILFRYSFSTLGTRGLDSGSGRVNVRSS